MLKRAVRIEWGDCDPAGIVFYPRYLDMFNESTIQLFEAAGFPKKRHMLKEMGVAGFPMVDLQTRFMRPTAYGDDVVIETDPPEWGGKSFKIHHRLMKDGVLCVECHETRVWTVPAPDRPGGLTGAVVPDEVREKFAAAAAAAM